MATMLTRPIWVSNQKFLRVEMPSPADKNLIFFFLFVYFLPKHFCLVVLEYVVPVLIRLNVWVFRCLVNYLLFPLHNVRALLGTWDFLIRKLPQKLHHTDS